MGLTIQEKYNYEVSFECSYLPRGLEYVHLTWGQEWRELVTCAYLQDGHCIVNFQSIADLSDLQDDIFAYLSYRGRKPEVKLRLGKKLLPPDTL